LLDIDVDKSKNNVSPVETLFERDVLLQTAKIPYREVRTYKYIAEKLQTHTYQAVGSALAKNPFPLIIPCHRVVKSVKSWRIWWGVK
jgi:methylated-DNA-[protein]-cysteine S-methyltransferase